MRRARLAPLVVLAALAGLVASGAGSAQDLVERFDVAPQTLSRERRYLEAGIAATRRAYGLDGVDVRPLAAGRRLSPRTAAENRSTLENVPLWDTGVLRPAMNELQSIGGYYSFPSTTVDRYTVDGVPRLMTVAARQLDLGGLRRESRTWANERFAYTHGYGVVAVHGGRDRRRPATRSSRRAPSARAGTRCGWRSRASTSASGPAADRRTSSSTAAAARSSSRAPGIAAPGVPLRRPGRASRCRQPGDGGPRSRRASATSSCCSRRPSPPTRGSSCTATSRERVRTLAPFLRWDGTPQTVVADGRVQFLLHGYTTSEPLSVLGAHSAGRRGELRPRARAGRASTGSAAASRSTPATRRPDPARLAGRVPDAVPADRRACRAAALAPALPPAPVRRRRPTSYATYHADDVTELLERHRRVAASRASSPGPIEEAGEIQFPDSAGAARRGRATVRPRQPSTLADAPGVPPRAHARRAAPAVACSPRTFTPRGRQNLVSYLAGSVDRPGGPRLTLLSLPRDRLTIGPTQATREVLADPGVNARLQLLNRESRDLGRNSVNRTVLGVPRMVPVGDSLVHVQTDLRHGGRERPAAAPARDRVRERPRRLRPRPRRGADERAAGARRPASRRGHRTASSAGSCRRSEHEDVDRDRPEDDREQQPRERARHEQLAGEQREHDRRVAAAQAQPSAAPRPRRARRRRSGAARSARARPAAAVRVATPTAYASGSVPSASVYWLTAPASSTAMLWPPRPWVSRTKATTSSGVSVATGTIHWSSRYGLIPTRPAGAEHGVAERHRGEQDHERGVRHQPADPAAPLLARQRRELRGDAQRLGASPPARGRAPEVEDVQADQHGGVDQRQLARRRRSAATRPRRRRGSRARRGAARELERPDRVGPPARAGRSATAAGIATAKPSSRRLAPVRFAVTYSAWPMNAKWTSTMYSGRIATNATSGHDEPVGDVDLRRLARPREHEGGRDDGARRRRRAAADRDGPAAEPHQQPRAPCRPR